MACAVCAPGQRPVSQTGVAVSRPPCAPPTLLFWCHVPVVRRWRSDSLTVIKTPEGIDSNKIVKNAYSRYNLSIGIGLSQVCVCRSPCCCCVTLLLLRRERRAAAVAAHLLLLLLHAHGALS